MGRFLVRVVLHNTPWEHPNYEALHTAIEGVGLAKRILSTSGIYYQLPSAEYIINSALTLHQIYNLAFNTANFVDKNNAVFVSQMDDKFLFSGLPRD